jgi:hypothetical protein
MAGYCYRLPRARSKVPDSECCIAREVAAGRRHRGLLLVPQCDSGYAHAVEDVLTAGLAKICAPE